MTTLFCGENHSSASVLGPLLKKILKNHLKLQGNSGSITINSEISR